MYTAEDFFKDFMVKELRDKGIDIFKDDYYDKPEFKKLENEPFKDKIVMPKSWWIEKHIVGQERLKKIYGIYALGVEHEFSEEELTDHIWMDDLAGKYNEAKAGGGVGGRTVKDIQQYFYRKDKGKEGKDGKDGREELGLVERLRKLGFDVDKFDSQKAKEERIKLLYFLFGFEFERKVKIRPFLSQPSFENIDNSIAGDKTRNGELMAYLKNNIMKGIDENYIAELKEVLNLIIDRWEQQIFYVIYVSNAMADMKLLDEIYADLQWLLGLVEETPEEPVTYLDSLLETFYLKLSLHEMIGREQRLINISGGSFKEIGEVNEIQRKRCKEYLSELLPVCWHGDGRYKEVLKYVKEHREALAQCVLGKEKIDRNDKRKFDKAADSIIHFLDFSRDNTKITQVNHVPVLLLISHMQEHVFGNEKINVNFYRHGSEDKITLRKALDDGTASKEFQYAWIQKVNRRWYANLGTGDIYKKVREIERCLDRFLLSIYGSNSLAELKERAWLLLSYIEAFIDRRYIVEERYNFLIDFLKSRSFEMRRCNRQVIYQFLNQLDDIHFYIFMDEIKNYISDLEEYNVYNCFYDIEQDEFYKDGELEAFLEVEISVWDKTVGVVNGGVQLKSL